MSRGQGRTITKGQAEELKTFNYLRFRYTFTGMNRYNMTAYFTQLLNYSYGIIITAPPIPETIAHGRRPGDLMPDTYRGQWLWEAVNC